MATARVHIVCPADLIGHIDALVGKRSRSKFIAQVLQEEVRRRQSLKLIDEVAGSLKDEDYPLIAKLGSVEYVRRLRKEWDRPLPRRRRR